MAVIKGIEVTINVSGQVLQEYDDIDPDNKDGVGQSIRSSCKYIEAVSGARFEISSVVPKLFDSTFDTYCLEYDLDGADVDTNLVASSDFDPRSDSCKIMCRGAMKITRGEAMVKPFIFNEITLLNDHEHNNMIQGDRDVRFRPDLGTITVNVFREKLLEQSKLKESYEDDLDSVTSMHEKKLKGSSVTHSVSFAKEEKDQQNNACYDTSRVDDDHSPYATFNFKYRSRKALQGLLLIPRTPSPTPPPPPTPLEERPEDELTIAELRELARRQRATFELNRKANAISARSIKVEKGNQFLNGTKRVLDDEMEQLLASASSKKVKGPIASGEIVDLSG